MPAVFSSRPANRLLTALSAADFGLLQPHLQPVSLKLRLDLERPDRRIDDVYFPHVGIASVVAVETQDTRVQGGLVGNGGVGGAAPGVGNSRSPPPNCIYG